MTDEEFKRKSDNGTARKTKTSAEVKNRYNAKAYDRIPVVVPKGKKSKIEEFAKSKGFKSLNSFINDAIDKQMNL